MAEAYRKLYQGQPGTSAGTLYTVPAATEAIVRHIVCVNTSGATATIALFHDGTAAANQILPPVPLGAGEWTEFDGTLLFEAGDTLAGVAGAAGAITVTVYGLEVS